LAKPELGEKQICPNCGAKFYDLTKRPARCPKCATEFDPEEVVKTRRSRPRSPVDHEDELPEKPEAEADDVEVEAEDDFGEEADETPEIDQVDVEEVVGEDEDDDTAVEGVGVKKKSGPDDGLGVDFAADDEDAVEEDDDVPFLEGDDEFDEDEIDGLPEEGEERD